jgi:N-acetylglucosaminyl-diphospho-decaprenol L-rhamnosyltransferase
VSVVVPSLRGGPSVRRLAAALAREPDVELILADNGIPPDDATDVRRAGGRIVEMGRNRGFAAAVNAAVRIAEGEYLTITNDDIEPQPGFLEALVGTLAAGADMAAGVLLYGSSPETIESAGIGLDALFVPHDHLRGRSVAILERPVEPPLGACGGALGIRRSLFLELGGFDEQFFAYYEDVDLALRLRAAGGSCAVARGTRLVHHGSSTLGHGSKAKTAHVAFSRAYALRKYGILDARHPARSAGVLAAEALATMLQAARHRSIEPAAVRVRGWKSGRSRPAVPCTPAATVGLAEALRERAWRRRAPELQRRDER